MYPTANIVISGMDHPLQRYLRKLMNINEDGTLTASQPDRLNFQATPRMSTQRCSPSRSGACVKRPTTTKQLAQRELSSSQPGTHW